MPSVNSLPVPTYGVASSASNLDLSVGSIPHGRVSSFIIAQSRVSMIFSNAGLDQVISIDYRGIVVHGVSSAEKKSLYIMLKGDWRGEFSKLRDLSRLSIAEEGEGEEDRTEAAEEINEEIGHADQEAEEEDGLVTEIRLTPDDPSQLDAMNGSIASCIQEHQEVEDDELEIGEDDEEGEGEGEDGEYEKEVDESETLGLTGVDDSREDGDAQERTSWLEEEEEEEGDAAGEKGSVAAVASVAAAEPSRYSGGNRPVPGSKPISGENAGISQEEPALPENALFARNPLATSKDLPTEEEMTPFGLLTQRRLNTLLAANYFDSADRMV